jgi:hypothetical protein
MQSELWVQAAPNQDKVAYRPEQVLPHIREGLWAFVGATAFEELSRQWIGEASAELSRAQGRAAKLPFEVQEVGSHWSRGVQVDVVAVNWAERAILLGECKWGANAVDRGVVRELVEAKTPKVLKQLPDEGAGWRGFYAFFARAGFTDAARAAGEAVGARLVDLATLDVDLRGAVEGGKLEG